MANSKQEKESTKLMDNDNESCELLALFNNDDSDDCLIADESLIKLRIKNQLQNAFHIVHQKMAKELMLSIDEATLQEIIELYFNDIITRKNLKHLQTIKNGKSEEEANFGQQNEIQVLIKPVMDELMQILNIFNQKKEKFLNLFSSVMHIGGDYGCNNNEEQETEDNEHLNDRINDEHKLEMAISQPPMLKCSHNWQFWFWKSDKRFYLKWDQGLLKLGRPFLGVENLNNLLEQLIPVEQLSR